MKTPAEIINDVLTKAALGYEVEVDDEVAEKLAASIVDSFKRSLKGRVPKNKIEGDRKYIGASSVGKPCWRQLWYDQRQGDYPPEVLTPNAKFKFLFGDVIEELALGLAEVGGAEVTGRQGEIEIPIEGTDWVVLGKQDATINSATVDVKSSSTYGLRKFDNEAALKGDDPFGYIDQLSLYDTQLGNGHPPEFLVIGKETGAIKSLQISKPTSEEQLKNKLIRLVNVLDEETPPDRAFEDEPDGKSGNRKLCMTCSYCAYKSHCWEGYRTFLYSNKPVYLTKVVRMPKVPELK